MTGIRVVEEKICKRRFVDDESTMNLPTYMNPRSAISRSIAREERGRRANNAAALPACQAVRNSIQCLPPVCTYFCPDSRRKAWISELPTSRWMGSLTKSRARARRRKRRRRRRVRTGRRLIRIEISTYFYVSPCFHDHGNQLPSFSFLSLWSEASTVSKLRQLLTFLVLISDFSIHYAYFPSRGNLRFLICKSSIKSWSDERMILEMSVDAKI